MINIFKIFFAPALVFVIHSILSIKYHIYYIWPWFDIPMHFLGGASIALSAGFFFRYLYAKGFMQNTPRLMEIFLLVSIAALAGVFWEFIEFVGEYLMPGLPLQPSLGDTIGDLALDLLGAFLVSILLVFPFRNKRQKL